MTKYLSQNSKAGRLLQGVWKAQRRCLHLDHKFQHLSHHLQTLVRLVKASSAYGRGMTLANLAPSLA